MKPLRSAFTLIELLTVIAVVGILGTLLVTGVREVRYRARESQSISNIRQLATANFAYLADHGRYVPNANGPYTRCWHGRMKYGSFDGRDGYLSEYLENGQVRYCPVLLDLLDEHPEMKGSIGNDGTGGYGYNGTYIGGSPGATSALERLQGNFPANVENPSETVMFTSSAIVNGGRLGETGDSMPYRRVYNGMLGTRLTPTCHFRFRGKALVAWADGHATLEAPNGSIDNSWNAYGSDNAGLNVGWFGPADEYNGYWNPRFRDQRPY